MHQQSGWTATPSRLIDAPLLPSPPFLHKMPFLTQPSQFILAWDKHQICWLAYPVICTHTHTPILQPSGLRPGLPGWDGTRKAKPTCILLKQETLSGSGISWAICKSTPCSRQTRQHPTTQFFREARCPFCHPTNSIKTLKEGVMDGTIRKSMLTSYRPSIVTFPLS